MLVINNRQSKKKQQKQSFLDESSKPFPKKHNTSVKKRSTCIFVLGEKKSTKFGRQTKLAFKSLCLVSSKKVKKAKLLEPNQHNKS